MSKSLADCLFCKIIKREIPSNKLIETEHSYAFLDIFPLSKGHSLVVPKYHTEFLHQLPDENLADLLPVAKKVAVAVTAATEETQYNILQNNGPRAHQVVKHVHFHVIPKQEDGSGLIIEWPSSKASNQELEDLAKKIIEKL
ncbi:10489_t:CDS:2 [Ambispora leptoticha]|uniref:10489_t:CDS:1 n=1 Tax=Ambispora leptoticha TaxID=144679 RepID=A0A9N9C4L2_9GLOM|nr:10489_t:CDS:2 [Ambispora leptoticha]